MAKRTPAKPAPKKQKAAPVKPAPPSRADESEQYLGATEDRVGDRTGSGAGYDMPSRSKKPRKGGVASS